MTAYRKQAAFLKTLLAYSESEEHRRLQEQLWQAEQSERCILYACRLVGVIALLGVAGLGYSAVLLPEFFQNSSHFLIQFFSAIGLGSTMCLLVFLGLWVYYRSVVNRIHNECRRLITSMLESRLQLPEHTFYPAIVEDPNLRAGTIRLITHTETASLTVRKAS